MERFTTCIFKTIPTTGPINTAAMNDSEIETGESEKPTDKEADEFADEAFTLS